MDIVINTYDLINISLFYFQFHDGHQQHSYAFGYAIGDHQSEQHRQESGNGAGGVVGSYGFTDSRGISRRVHYIADGSGFRAQILTNEPGTNNQNPANILVTSDAFKSKAYSSTYGKYGYPHNSNGHGSVLGYSGLLGAYGNYESSV
ncbi:uncharacterized protein CDAR_406841 [Caerostris darwini]|uniref:Uncharacterized protein n=1 Tax=Caerostris darwini TaxID=1538125 RepID=A0AAV4RBP6_9ARAC|nr:uncharacterized protein CDAR_406841 [Caerostris darwini]